MLKLKLLNHQFADLKVYKSYHFVAFHSTECIRVFTILANITSRFKTAKMASVIVPKLKFLTKIKAPN